MKRKHNPNSTNLTNEARSRGGIVSAQRRRAKAMAQLKDMSPLAIAKMFYIRGWHQGARSTRKRMERAA
jgi:hypothetical protein